MEPLNDRPQEPGKPRVGIVGLTGCAGDQLQILNCEAELLRLADRLDIVDWVMVRSRNDAHGPLDVAFVEGVVATPRDLDTLRRTRARARTLVAIGTCAVWGGLPAMRNRLTDEELGAAALSDVSSKMEEARPATHFVPFEFALPGCPMERSEFLMLVKALLSGTVAELPKVPVCWECKTRENLCRVVYYGEVCCGAMTRGGCGARCPSHGVACAGCRGPVEEPCYDGNITMFKDRGISWMEIAERMENFSAPAWMKMGLEEEMHRGRKR